MRFTSDVNELSSTLCFPLDTPWLILPDNPLYPGQHLRHPSVDPGVASLGTADAPRHDANLLARSVVRTVEQRTPGVATAGVTVIVAGTEHVTSNPSWCRAPVATLAPPVCPDLDVHLHKVCWLAARLAESPPSRDSYRPVHVLITPAGQTDGLDVVGVLDVVFHGQDSHVIPQVARGESLVTDDSLHPLLYGDAVTGSILDVVVAKTNSQVLNVVFAHMSDTVSCGQNMIVINERPTTKLSVAIHQSGHEGELVWYGLLSIDYVRLSHSLVVEEGIPEW